jgi:Protein of unknown function (DUF4229)
MRSFVVYTAARLGLFLGVYSLVWLAIGRSVAWDSVSALYTALIAMVVSSLIALVALRGLRARLAADVAARAGVSRAAAQRAAAARAAAQRAAAARAAAQARTADAAAPEPRTGASPAASQPNREKSGEDSDGVRQLGETGVAKDRDQG